MMLGMAEASLQQGLLYGVPAVAAMFAFRIAGFPDLTLDGSFALGASIAGVLIQSGWSPLSASLVGAVGGAIAGLGTSLLHVVLGISKLLSGILMMLILYSLSLRIMGAPNVSLLDSNTLLSMVSVGVHGSAATVFAALHLLVIAIVVWAFLSTRLGLRLRATGDSESAASTRGLFVGRLSAVGLIIANGLAAWSGAVVAQFQGFVDIGMGGGLVISSLACLVIGETLVRPERVSTLIVAAGVGAICYHGMVGVALQLGLAPANLKVTTAVLALGFLVLDRLIGRRQRGRIIGNRSI